MLKESGSDAVDDGERDADSKSLDAGLSSHQPSGKPPRRETFTEFKNIDSEYADFDKSTSSEKSFFSKFKWASPKQPTFNINYNKTDNAKRTSIIVITQANPRLSLQPNSPEGTWTPFKLPIGSENIDSPTSAKAETPTTPTLDESTRASLTRMSSLPSSNFTSSDNDNGGIDSSAAANAAAAAADRNQMTAFSSMTASSSSNSLASLSTTPSQQPSTTVTPKSAPPPPAAPVPSSPAQSAYEKYNISNVLKQIYTLKYLQRSNQSTPPNVTAANSSTPSAIDSPTSVNSSSNLRQFWMPDDQVKECYECNKEFTAFRRRHHCRVCGQIFCGKCSNYEIPSQLIWPNSSGNIRACTFCHSFASQMQAGDLKQNTSSIRELVKRLSLTAPSFYSGSNNNASAAPNEAEQNNFIKNFVDSLTSSSGSVTATNSNNNQQASSFASPANSPAAGALSTINSLLSGGSSLLQSPSSAANSASSANLTGQAASASAAIAALNDAGLNDNNPFDVTENKDYIRSSHDVEMKQLIMNNSLELRNLWVQIYHTSDGLTFQTRSINKFKKINNCITGIELVEWLIKKKSVSKDQAIVIGQALVHGKWLEVAYQLNQNTQNSSLQNQIFYDDNTYYKPGPSALNYNQADTMFGIKKEILDAEEGPDWIKELNKLVSNLEEDPSLQTFDNDSNNLNQDPAESASIGKSMSVSNSDQSIKTIDSNQLADATKAGTKMQQPLTLPISSSLEQIAKEKTVKPEDTVVPMIKIMDKANYIDEAPLLANPNIISTVSTPTVPSAPTLSITETWASGQGPKTLSTVNDTLQQVHKQFQIELFKQLLKLKNMSFEWFDIIMPIVWKCVDLVKPDVKHDNDSMDIRAYIKIKKLHGSEKKECRIVNGLVFTKNVAHKLMKTDLKHPKILLFRSSIEYQRTEEKLCSLEPIYKAESQYLKNHCSKLLLRQNPEILVVEKSVARTAQEIFLQSGVSLVLNVKSTIMDKLCRFLQADPMYSIDDLMRKPKLGYCSRFHVEKYNLTDNQVKSLMFFEGTPTNLGCTILLSGASASELATIKSLIRFMIYVAYNSKLEQSFILDKYADFSLKNTIFDHSNENAASILNRERKSNVERKSQSETGKDQETPKVTEKAQTETKQTGLIKKEIKLTEGPLDTQPIDSGDQEEDSSKPNDSILSTPGNNKSELSLKLCETHKDRTPSAQLLRNFKLLLDDLILSCSPFINFNMPFLLIENPMDKIRIYLPINYARIFLESKILLNDCQVTISSSPVGPGPVSLGFDKTTDGDDESLESSESQTDSNLHEFLLLHLTKSFDDDEIRKLYADYRSRGGIASLNSCRRLILTTLDQTALAELKNLEPNENEDEDFPVANAKSKQPVMLQHSQPIQQAPKQQVRILNDCLEVMSRQHLAVLFFSQNESSPIYPNICQRPRIIKMNYYGENDMTLGSFLARNCFRNGYKCNNELCDTLIIYHTRSFVHHDYRMTVRMSVVPNSASTASNTAALQSNSSNSNMAPASSQSANNSSTQNSASTNEERQKQQHQQYMQQQQFANLSVSALSSAMFNPTATGSSPVASSVSLSSYLQSSPASQSQISTLTSATNLSPSTKKDSAQNSGQQNQPLSTSGSGSSLPSQSGDQSQQQQAIVYDDINIFMWSVCQICNKSSKKLTMSPHTWSFSLAKFLELSFHSKSYFQFHPEGAGYACKHHLFHDHYQYFRFKNIVTVFSMSKINLRRLFLPPRILKPNKKEVVRSRSEYIDEIKEIYEKGLSISSTLVERIGGLKALNLHEKQIQKLDQYIMQIQTDQTLKHKIETINLLLTNQITVDSKNNPEQDSDNEYETSNIDSESCCNESNVSTSSTGGTVKISQINYDQVEVLIIEIKKYLANYVLHWNTKMSEFFKKSKFDDDSSVSTTPNTSNLASEAASSSFTSTTPIEIPKFGLSGKQPLVSNSSSSFVNKDDECNVEKQMVSLINESNDSGASSALLSQPPEPKQLNEASHTISAPLALDDDHSKSATTASAISLGKRFIANLIPSSAFQPLKLQFPEEEHFLLNCDSSYYVNDKNLSSIVAFTLGSKEYKEFLHNALKAETAKLAQGQQFHPVQSANGGQYLHGAKESYNLINNALQDIDEFDINSANNPANKSADSHFEFQFADSTTRFYCKVYYADLFSKLRKLIMPNDEDKYIHSLFRCMNWDAKGGKSNSQFRKTIDNRFVLKEMSRQEVQSFLEFAPQYVQYVSDCFHNKKASALAKILGAYRICLMKNTTIASKAVKMDVIVLENLFYSKKFTHVFDLKGSERNRLVNLPQQSSKPSQDQDKDLVLLDENFLQWTFNNPIYIKTHSKHVLMNAIANDAQFLSSKFVMDYSLLCGFDQVNNEVVVGIIDYLRVFTWDKKVETYLKTISGQGKMPTIVSPEVYRTRFINAIDRYFLEVPDQWYQETSTLSSLASGSSA